ncbi:MAG: hypothetical protein OER96_04460, partial [Gammaproteobacteria bacterium]|nr:hypothetical protein [Gammaproteobacteria bacterium]
MTEESGLFVVMNWASESLVEGSGEPEDFMYETSGKLIYVSVDDERSFVGRFRLYYIDVERAVNEG